MSDDQAPITGQEGEGQIESMPVEEPRRAASITLRDDDAAASRSASMEIANQSLADALRIVFRLLQVVMIALVLLFILSGLQQVNEGERGVLLTFGKASANEIEPGFVMSFPHPIGEVVKIPTGTDSIDLLDSFWPEGLDPSRADSGKHKRSLKPGDDGSLLTADHNIVHVQLTVSYHREDAGQFIRNIYTDHLAAMIRANVERATVQVVASTPIDEMLKRGRSTDQVGGQESSDIEARIRGVAQRSLDGVESGLIIDRVTLREVRPPPSTADEFNRVNEAVTAAARLREEADREREELLTSVAGSGYRPMLAMIDEYERVLDIDGQDAAEGVMAEIRKLLNGELNGQPVRVGDRSFERVRLSGEISSKISRANQYRSAVVARAQNRVEDYLSKLEEYRANPKVFLTSEWTSAMIEFLGRTTVETYRIDAGMEPLNIRLNPDPQTARDMELEFRRQEIDRSSEKQRAYRAGKAPGEK